ncbi:carboxypeptidase-like regulatory domain-containing protein [Kaistella flava (ex Peng et al. 2021)]|uniref:Carboxypeptidase-like regulatory domain-containing protein n=1 Tax=Kaistella flava (ex Peng et al. 2021) TaxID=2038776 RepID=A0A7M2YC44_9FLAO|nr:carboxypeptidase-like regulatory domain-containing protein [Kaistella flava (ex Peng et al. 2021)]QOW11691.1 carboxypeptidase-like regulatory domain-containing protein [Kaistella flava (ex Peng et al. 2021)]
MNKFLVFIVLFLTAGFQAQVISGITFTENDRPLSEVNIYVDGSKIYTVSDGNGNFSLDVQNQKNAALVFQKNGYETFSVQISEAVGKKVKIVLLKVQDIEEVVLIPYTDEAYNKFISYFLGQFVGIDQENVKIKNQKTLKFAFDKKNQILKVKAPQTLIIENKRLAYQIQFNLLNFEADFRNNTVAYSGTSFFKDVNPKKINEVNRLNAYHGSIMHFLRSAYQDQIAEQGFWVNHIVKLDKDKIVAKEKALAVIETKIPTSSFIEKVGDKKTLAFKDILQVNYPKHYFAIVKSKIVKETSMVQQTSYIYVDGNSFDIYPDGNSSDPEQMILQGSLSNNKMGNFLPLDYEPKID